jgi:hypothetical protein
VPSVYWAYNTGGGTAVTSPVLSGDGTKVAFIETSSTNHAILRILKWKSGQGSFNTGTDVWTSAPVDNTSLTSWSTCSAGQSCMISITFNGNPQDTNSSPFYDFNSDTIYVGADDGTLHKFINVFGVSGTTPSEVTTGGWPAALTNSSGMKTSSPVLDSSSSNIFVGTQRTGVFNGTGGYFYRVNPSSGAVTASSQIAEVPGIVDAPVVDSVAAQVYLSSPDDSLFTCGFFAPCGAMFQFSTTFASGNGGTKEQLGTGAQSAPIYAGAFDNIYFTASNASSPSGNIYVCGDTGGSSAAVLYRVPIASNAIGSPSTGPTLSSSGTTCSPVTEFVPSTASTDLIFMSVQSNGSTAGSIGCPNGGGGCAVSFNVNSGVTPASTASRVGATGGTSGIIVDNNVTSNPTGGSQVYFSQLSNATCGTSTGSGGCAIQASQAALTEYPQ